MADDVLLNKAAAIERAVRRVREEHAGDDRNLLDNQTRQDAAIHVGSAGEGAGQRLQAPLYAAEQAIAGAYLGVAAIAQQLAAQLAAGRGDPGQRRTRLGRQEHALGPPVAGLGPPHDPAVGFEQVELIDISDDTEAVVRRLGLRPSGYAAAVKATLLLAAVRAELAAVGREDVEVEIGRASCRERVSSPV